MISSLVQGCSKVTSRDSSTCMNGLATKTRDKLSTASFTRWEGQTLKSKKLHLPAQLIFFARFPVACNMMVLSHLKVYISGGRPLFVLSEAQKEEVIAQADSHLKTAKGRGYRKQITRPEGGRGKLEPVLDPRPESQSVSPRNSLPVALGSCLHFSLVL